ncbi:MAG: hypothetical protein U5Q44_05470 [Dehalococcoidia bacterium]|nr:hypothetical protein [Dehalococcoidia bacterium]
MHAWRGWHWWPDADAFEVTVGAVLVQNTSWTNAERGVEALRAAGVLKPDAMDALDLPRLEALVRPSGQYRQKARKLKAFLDTCREAGGFAALLQLPVAELRRRLLATWGIGPETADAIIVYAARKPAFVIDAYTVRILGRLGMGPGPTAGYEAWQRYFVERLPCDRDLWARYHALLVMHAKHLWTKQVCRMRRPRSRHRARLPGPRRCVASLSVCWDQLAATASSGHGGAYAAP